MTKVTGPLFKWFGSKWTLSKHYPPPEHDTIIEPFAGSAGYSLRYARHGVRRIILSEKHDDVRALWSWLVNAKESDIREIPIFPPGVDLRTQGLTKGQALLVRMWQRTNNVSPTWHTSPWSDKPGQWTPNTRARVAEESGVVKNWKIVEPLFGGTLRMTIPRDATWFIDPPYIGNYQYGCKRIDYNALAAFCEQRSGQVIVCEALGKDGSVPDWLPFLPFRRQVTSRRKEGLATHSSEYMWTARNLSIPPE